MFQELLGGASLIGGERKPSISNPFEGSPSPSPSPSPCSSTTTGSATPASSSAAADNQNLRCPRCDSANTKFCYYNNYNLTQPRHFCKTCRRYWTKGGALRNVPIGGGCRKNKSIVSVTSSVNGKTSGGGRFMKAVSSEMGKADLRGGGFDQEIPLNPVLWASSAQNSHLMALLRATQNPNPNPTPLSNFIGSHLTSGSESMGASEALSSSSFWRNNQNQSHQNHHHHHQQQQQKMGLVVGEVQNSGFQDIYQRLRSTANYYPPHDHSVPLLFTTSSSSSSTILDSAPVAAAEMGYWNPTLTWSDLQTTNAAYP